MGPARRVLVVAVGAMMGWAGCDADNTVFATPAPATIHSDSPPQIRAGNGWFAPERDRTDSWRWTSGEAELIAEVSDAGPYRLTFELNSLKVPRTVMLQVETQTTQLRVAAPGIYGAVLLLPAGQSVIRLVASEKCLRPLDVDRSPDTRCLAVMLKHPMIVKDTPQPF